MSATEWLLIEGPASGQKLMILHGRSVLFQTPRGFLKYQGHSYVHRGKVFQLGLLDPSAVDELEIARMIDESGLQAVVDLRPGRDNSPR